MKRIIYILTLFLILLNTTIAEAGVTQKEYTTTAQDGFTIKSTLEYQRVKGKKEFNTVVLLHSLGYSSQWWEDLPNELLKNGYAVLLIDLRGHGESVYNKKLVRTSWNNLTNKAFAKYPDDVIKVIEQIKTENTKTQFFNNWAFVGADIGGSTAILASQKIKNKPKTIVLMSPVVNTKGLFVPVSLANLNNIDILSITGINDNSGQEAEKYLKRFVQSTFAEYTSDSKSNGMMLLKNDKTLSKVIASWIKEYL